MTRLKSYHRRKRRAIERRRLEAKLFDLEREITRRGLGRSSWRDGWIDGAHSTPLVTEEDARAFAMMLSSQAETATARNSDGTYEHTFNFMPDKEWPMVIGDK